MDTMGGNEMELRRALTRKLVAPLADEAGHKLSKVKGTNHCKNTRKDIACLKERTHSLIRFFRIERTHSLIRFFRIEGEMFLPVRTTMTAAVSLGSCRNISS